MTTNIWYNCYALGIFLSYMPVSAVSVPTVTPSRRCVCRANSLSHVWLFEMLWTVSCQAPLSIGLSRQGYWRGLPFPAPGIFPTQGSNPGLPHCRWILYQLGHKGSPILGVLLFKFRVNVLSQEIECQQPQEHLFLSPWLCPSSESSHQLTFDAEVGFWMWAHEIPELSCLPSLLYAHNSSTVCMVLAQQCSFCAIVWIDHAHPFMPLHGK